MNHLKYELQTAYGYNDLQILQISYIITSFVSEISKMILIGIYFLYINKFPEFLTAMIFLLSVRFYTGGLHLKHYISCLIFSFGIFFLGICILSEYIHLTRLTMLILLIVCMLLIWLIGPVSSSYRPVLSENQKKKCKLRAIFSLFFYIVLLFSFHEIKNLDVGFWIILLQVFQLGIAKIKTLKKGAAL